MLCLLSAVFLCFSLSMTTSFSHDDLIKADERELKFNKWRGNGTHSGKDDDLSVSFKYLVLVSTANSCLMLSLLVGIVAYLSLSLSPSQSDPKYFKKWRGFYIFIVFAAFATMIVGITEKYEATSVAVEAIYPRYRSISVAASGGGFFNIADSKVKEYFIDTPGQGIDPAGLITSSKFGNPSDWLEDKGLSNARGVLQSTAQEYTDGVVLASIICCALMFLSLILPAFAVLLKKRKIIDVTSGEKACTSVHQCLKTLGYVQYETQFHAHQLDWETLLLIEDQMYLDNILKEIGITTVAHRVKIAAFVAHFRHEWTSAMV